MAELIVSPRRKIPMEKSEDEVVYKHVSGYEKSPTRLLTISVDDLTISYGTNFNRQAQASLAWAILDYFICHDIIIPDDSLMDQLIDLMTHQAPEVVPNANSIPVPLNNTFRE